MCIPTEETFQKVKRLYNRCTCVCASGGDGRGRRSHFVRLFVFPVYEAVSTPPEAVCVSLCV